MVRRAPSKGWSLMQTRNKTAKGFCWMNGLAQDVINLQSSDYLLPGHAVNPGEN